MLKAYRQNGNGVQPLKDAVLADAIWIDLYRPDADEVRAVAALGHAVPSLDEMEEIEISNRLFREAGADFMTVVLPGLTEADTPLAGPVSFILSEQRLITVRHHAPRPFDTFPDRADKTATGTGSAEHIFLGLMDEIIARLADLLEGVGKALDGLSARVFGGDGYHQHGKMRAVLQEIGRQGELLGRVRLGLLTVERALSFYDQTLDSGDAALRAVVKGAQRDISALGVHADFLSSRISLIDDATLGMINLEQNATVRIFSIVAVLFMPPTLVASVYGMNFRFMPELAHPWGYPAALIVMVASALVTYLFFKWRRWL
ncbi:magnesium transporter CorA family protein [Actibacterium sp. D379-3]